MPLRTVARTVATDDHCCCFIMMQIYKDSDGRSNPYAGINWSVEDLLTAFSHEVLYYIYIPVVPAVM